MSGRRHGAASAVAAVQAAAETPYVACKAWAKYLKEQSRPDGRLPVGAEDITTEIASLAKKAGALFERLIQIGLG